LASLIPTAKNANADDETPPMPMSLESFDKKDSGPAASCFVNTTSGGDRD